MLISFLKTRNFIPTYYSKSIYEIDFDKLYADGIRLILTDLDNTLIAYDQHLPTEELREWKTFVEGKGFEVIIVSNSHKQRVSKFSNDYGIKYNHSSYKPSKFGLKRAIKMAESKYKKSEIVLFGDQLMTDVFGANRLGIKVLLVDPIKRKTEIRSTKINRRLEARKIRKIKKKYPNEYSKYLRGK